MHQKATLDNGLRLITTSMRHTHSVSLCIFIGVGSRYEPDASAGISHFIEHLSFKGTPRRPVAKEIAAAIEGVGGVLNAGTDKELTIYWCKVARPHFDLALDVLVDMLLNSKFDPAEVERERKVIVEEIHTILDAPSQRVGMLIDEILWPDHPLGRDIAGSVESVSGISQEMIVDFQRNRYRPGNVVISVAGDIVHEEIVEAVGRVTRDWGGQRPPADFLAYKGGVNPRLKVEDRHTEQTHLCLALPGLPLLHPKRYALDLLNVILGEGMSSRLFVEIRDNLGLAYSIHSYVEHLHDSGAMVIYAGVEHDKLAVAVRAILGQVALLREPVPKAELDRARELSKGRLLLRMEDSRSVAGWTGGQEILTDNILTVDEVVAIIDAITAEQISQVAQELFLGAQLRLAVVGPAAGADGLEDLLSF